MDEKQIEKKTVTITRMSITDKKKDGTKLQTKAGSSCWRVGIQTEEYGEQWLNGFLFYAPKNWKGETKEIGVWEEEFNGKKQLNFIVVETEIEKRIRKIETKVDFLVDALKDKTDDKGSSHPF